MHCCVVLLCEVYYVIVLGLGIIVVFFVTSLETCYSPGLGCSTLDNAIHWINLYAVDSAISFPITYPLDIVIFLARVVQTLDSAIHRINHYPADKC